MAIALRPPQRTVQRVVVAAGTVAALGIHPTGHRIRLLRRPMEVAAGEAAVMDLAATQDQGGRVRALLLSILRPKCAR